MSLIFLFENSLMLEILSVTIDSIERTDSSICDDYERRNKQQSLANAIIQMLATSPYKRLLAPYFTKILTFQCGIRAKILSHGFLLSKSRQFCIHFVTIFFVVNYSFFRGSSEYLLSIEFQPIVDLLNRFKWICEKYCGTIMRSLSGLLSPSTMKAILQRIQTTVEICGISEVANELMTILLSKDDLRRKILDHFFQPHGNRFKASTNQVRKLLSFVFKSSSKKNIERFQLSLEEYVRKELIEKLNLDSFNEGSSISATSAVSFLEMVVDSFSRTKSVCRLEMRGTMLSQNSVERAWQSYFSSLSSKNITSVAIAFAVGINTLIDTQSNCQLTPSVNLALLDAAVNLFQVLTIHLLLNSIYNLLR